MHELVKLVTHWTSFTDKHPGAKADDFCRHYLATHAAEEHAQTKARGSKTAMSMDLDSRFVRAVTRTAMSIWTYMRIALKDTSLKNLENFTLLAALRIQGESRKSDIINYAMMEFSTGIVILNRLVAQKLVHERIDPDDKRGRLLRLTAKGEKSLVAAFKKNQLARQVLLQGVSDADKQVCVQVLDPIHLHHAVQAVESRGKTIEELLGVEKG